MLREELAGHAAIGHVRYSTTGSSKLCNAQPLLRQYLDGPGRGRAQRQPDQRRRCSASEYEEHGHIFQSTTDTEIIVHLLAKPTHVEKHDPLPHVLQAPAGRVQPAVPVPRPHRSLPRPVGHPPAGARARPPDGHWCVASETCAFDAIDATYVRDVEPGEIVRIDDDGLHSRRFDTPAAGAGALRVRARLLRQPRQQDLRPERPPRPRGDGPAARPRGAGRRPTSSCRCPTPAAARRWASPRNRASRSRKGSSPTASSAARSSCPARRQRDRAVAMKLNIIPDVVDGQADRDRRGLGRPRHDDALEDARPPPAPARRRSTCASRCPPIRHPCFYGIDFPTSEELIAHNRTVEQIREFLEVDSLAYLSLEGMLACMKHARRATTAPRAGAGSTRSRSTSRRASSASSATS